MSEVEIYDNVVLRVDTEKGTRWLTVRDKFAPFGYVPAELRGQPAFRLVPGLPQDVVASDGALDSVAYEGRASVAPDGSASMQLVMTFTGNRAIAWRNVFDKLAEGRLVEFMEKDIVGRTFDGGHVREASIEHKSDVDLPLVVKLKVAVPQLARPNGGGLLLKEIFPMDLSQLATLPERQTPLLRRSSWHTEVHFEVVFPDAMKMPTTLPRGEARHGDATVKVGDQVRARDLLGQGRRFPGGACPARRAVRKLPRLRTGRRCADGPRDRGRALTPCALPRPAGQPLPMAPPLMAPPLPRTLEPEVMDTEEEARDYDAMDHRDVNTRFCDDLLELLDGKPPRRALDVGTGTALIPIELL